mgnify:CR=1 FL=1
MIKPVLAALVAAFIPTTAIAGIHDFSADRARPTTPTSNIKGNCHQTQDQSRYCYMQTSSTDYVLSIVDNDDRSYPQVMSVNCSSGDYKGWGVLNNNQLRVWASAFCSQM